MTTEEKVTSVVAAVLDIAAKDVTDGMARGHVAGWDSLQHMELVVALEHAFDLKLSFDDIIKMDDVASIKRLMKAKAG
jgi:acyl carrier protein